MLEAASAPQGANVTITSENAAPKRASMKQIVRMTAIIFGLSTNDLLGKERARRIAWPRHFAAAAIRDSGVRGGKSGRNGSYSLPAIARHFNRDHTSIIHAVRNTHNRMKTDRELAAIWHRMQQYCDDPQIFETDLAVCADIERILACLNFPEINKNRIRAKHLAYCQSRRIPSDNAWWLRRQTRSLNTERTIEV